MCNIAYNTIQRNDRVTISINDRIYHSNLIFATSLSESIRGSVILDATRTFFAFYCFIQDQNTYTALESIFNGTPNQSLMKDQVIQDIFVVGQEMKCLDMISLFVQRYNGQPINISTLDDHVIFSKYMGFTNQFVDFFARNILEIPIPKCVKIFKDLGYDFVESVFMICQKEGTDINNHIINLIESDLVYIDLINFINNKLLDNDQIIRMTHILYKTLQSGNETCNIMLDYYRSCIIERQLKKYNDLRSQISNLQNENTYLKSIISKLQNENTDMKCEVTNVQKDVDILKTP